MTLQEVIEYLNGLVDIGIPKDTLVVLSCEDYDPDPDVTNVYYCAERDRICIRIE